MGCCDSAAQGTNTNAVGGIKTYYNESNVWQQGTLSSFKYNTTFYGKVGNWVTFFKAHTPTYLSPYLNSISSLGVYVCRSDGCVSKHNYGTAFDLSALRWHDGFGTIRTWTALNYPNDRKFYLGVEASLHYYFKWVLDYNYNAAHRNHLHFDTTYAPSYSTSSTAQTKFLQASLTYVWGINTTIDGIWGTQTSTNSTKALCRIGKSGVITTTSNWLAYALNATEIGTGKKAVPTGC